MKEVLHDRQRRAFALVNLEESSQGLLTLSIGIADDSVLLS